MHTTHSNTQYKNESSTVKWAQWDKTQSRELYVCASHCAQLLHTILHRTDLTITEDDQLALTFLDPLLDFRGKEHCSGYTSSLTMLPCMDRLDDTDKFESNYSPPRITKACSLHFQGPEPAVQVNDRPNPLSSPWSVPLFGWLTDNHHYSYVVIWRGGATVWWLRQ